MHKGAQSTNGRVTHCVLRMQFEHGIMTKRCMIDACEDACGKILRNLELPTNRK